MITFIHKIEAKYLSTLQTPRDRGASSAFFLRTFRAAELHSPRCTADILFKDSRVSSGEVMSIGKVLQFLFHLFHLLDT